MNDPVIQVKNLRKIFSLQRSEVSRKTLKVGSVINSSQDHSLLVLDDLSFSVSQGETVGIIGSNGSGKTTLLKIISGIYIPTSGDVKINGKIAPLLQIGTGFNIEFSAKENIIIYGMLLGFSKSEIEEKIDEIIEFAELQEFASMKLKHYSAGMRVRLAFSTALQVNPDILLVDEVLSVGDMAFRQKSFKSFLSFKNKGKTILFTSHSMDMISQLSDRVLLLHGGKILLDGKPEEAIKKFKEISIGK